MGARAIFVAGLLAVTGAAGSAWPKMPRSRRPRRRRTIPSPGSRRSRASGRSAWARAENARTLGELQGDRRYQQYYDRALAILQARDRIPDVTFRPDGLYNFWQDADHVRGIVRRTTLASYRTDDPDWETVLDVDALAAAEGKSWVYQGMSCLPPERAPLPGHPFRRRPRRQCRARIRPARAPLRRGRLQPARRQAERRPGRTRTRCWSRATGARER